ncbi:MAG: hypothetical protein JWP34_4546 [Massilia sp.]|nr:hypothetical protein [Massilia sp.]
MNIAKGVVSAEVRAVITRADGTVEDLGVVSYWHKNRLKRWWMRHFKVWKGER